MYLNTVVQVYQPIFCATALTSASFSALSSQTWCIKTSIILQEICNLAFIFKAHVGIAQHSTLQGLLHSTQPLGSPETQSFSSHFQLDGCTESVHLQEKIQKKELLLINCGLLGGGILLVNQKQLSEVNHTFTCLHPFLQ